MKKKEINTNSMQKPISKYFKYQSAEEFEKVANEYFNNCDTNMRWKRTDFIKSGERAGELVDINLPTPYTIEGLCLHLKISVQTFYDYVNAEHSPHLVEVATIARDRIREQNISGAHSNIFNAVTVSRIHGLRDNVDVTTDGVKIQPITNLLFNTDTFKADK